MKLLKWRFLAASLIFLELAFSEFDQDNAFQWKGFQSPEKHQFRSQIGSKDETVSIVLADSPILTKSKVYHRYQVFAVDKLIDHSEPSVQGFNLVNQIARYSPHKLQNHERFVSLPNFQYEYRFHHRLTFQQCETICIFDKAGIVRTINHVRELKELIPRSTEYIWAAVNQTYTTNNNVYKLEFDFTEIIPRNLFGGNASTQIFHYHQGSYAPLHHSYLHGRVKYYNYERGSYYSKQPHQLLARVNVHDQWQVLVPQWSGTQPSEFARGLCACVRDLSLNLKNARMASLLAEEARFRTIRSPQKLEIQRVKKVSPSPALSNVESILKDQRYYVPEERTYMDQSDLYDLRLEAALHNSLIEQGQNLTRLVNMLSQSQQPSTSRQRRAMPLAASLGLGVISKVVEFSLPYMIPKGEGIIRSIKKEIGGSLMRVPKKRKISDAISFQDYLSSRFQESPTNISVESDRIKISLRDRNPALRSLADPSLEQAQLLQSTSRHLQYLEKNVLPYLPTLLVDQIITELPFPIRPESDILIRIQSSGTFSVIRYFFELHRYDLSYTEVQTYALPYKQIEKKYFSFAIQNRTILDSVRENRGKLRDEECLNLVLASTPSNLAQVCQEVEYKPEILRKIFDLKTGSIVVFPGRSSLSIDCLNHPTIKLNPQHQFNIFFIAHSCQVSIIHQRMSARLEQTVFHEDNLTYQILLGVDVPLFSSKHDKVYMWLISLSITMAVVFAIVAFIYMSMSFVKLRYKPQIKINEDGIIDVSVKHIHRKLSNSPSFLRDSNEPMSQSQPIVTGASYRADTESLQIMSEANDLKSTASLFPQHKKTKPAAH